MAKRQPPRTRKTNKTVLIVTNGSTTEVSYLSEMKRRAKRAGVRIRVEFVNGEPMTMLKKLKSPNGDSSAYDEIWLVVDEDGTDRTSFVDQCRNACNKNQIWVAVVSRPCFEVWLIAHYQQVRNYSSQDDAQQHYGTLLPKGSPKKAIALGFPYDAMGEALTRCHLVGQTLGGPNTLPPSPGTAMPHLVVALEALR